MKEITKEINIPQIVKRYVADDGKEFDNEIDCEEYEAFMFFKECEHLFNIHKVNYFGEKWYALKYDEKNHDKFIKLINLMLDYNFDYVDEDEIYARNLYGVSESKIIDIKEMIKNYKYENSECYLFDIDVFVYDDGFYELNLNVLNYEQAQEKINKTINDYNSIFRKEFKQNSKEFDEIFW